MKLFLRLLLFFTCINSSVCFAPDSATPVDNGSFPPGIALVQPATEEVAPKEPSAPKKNVAEMIDLLRTSMDKNGDQPAQVAKILGTMEAGLRAAVIREIATNDKITDDHILLGAMKFAPQNRQDASKPWPFIGLLGKRGSIRADLLAVAQEIEAKVAAGKDQASVATNQDAPAGQTSSDPNASTTPGKPVDAPAVSDTNPGAAKTLITRTPLPEPQAESEPTVRPDSADGNKPDAPASTPEAKPTSPEEQVAREFLAKNYNALTAEAFADELKKLRVEEQKAVFQLAANPDLKVTPEGGKTTTIDRPEVLVGMLRVANPEAANVYAERIKSVTGAVGERSGMRSLLRFAATPEADNPALARLKMFANISETESAAAKAKVAGAAIGGGLGGAILGGIPGIAAGGAAAYAARADNQKDAEIVFSKLKTAYAAAQEEVSKLGAEATAMDRLLASYGIKPGDDPAAKLEDLNKMIETISKGGGEDTRATIHAEKAVAILELASSEDERAKKQFETLAKKFASDSALGNENLEEIYAIMKGLGLEAPTDAASLRGNKALAREMVSLALQAREETDPAKAKALRDQAEAKTSEKFGPLKVPSFFQRFISKIVSFFTGTKDRKINPDILKSVEKDAKKPVAPTTDAEAAKSADAKPQDSAPNSTARQIEVAAIGAAARGLQEIREANPERVAESERSPQIAETPRALAAASARAQVNWSSLRDKLLSSETTAKDAPATTTLPATELPAVAPQPLTPEAQDAINKALEKIPESNAALDAQRIQAALQDSSGLSEGDAKSLAAQLFNAADKSGAYADRASLLAASTEILSKFTPTTPLALTKSEPADQGDSSRPSTAASSNATLPAARPGAPLSPVEKERPAPAQPNAPLDTPALPQRPSTPPAAQNQGLQADDAEPTSVDVKRRLNAKTLVQKVQRSTTLTPLEEEALAQAQPQNMAPDVAPIEQNPRPENTQAKAPSAVASGERQPGADGMSKRDQTLAARAATKFVENVIAAREAAAAKTVLGDAFAQLRAQATQPPTSPASPAGTQIKPADNPVTVKMESPEPEEGGAESSFPDQTAIRRRSGPQQEPDATLATELALEDAMADRFQANRQKKQADKAAKEAVTLAEQIQSEKDALDKKLTDQAKALANAQTDAKAATARATAAEEAKAAAEKANAEIAAMASELTEAKTAANERATAAEKALIDAQAAKEAELAQSKAEVARLQAAVTAGGEADKAALAAAQEAAKNAEKALAAAEAATESANAEKASIAEKLAQAEAQAQEAKAAAATATIEVNAAIKRANAAEAAAATAEQAQKEAQENAKTIAANAILAGEKRERILVGESEESDFASLMAAFEAGQKTIEAEARTKQAQAETAEAKEGETKALDAAKKALGEARTVKDFVQKAVQQRNTAQAEAKVTERNRDEAVARQRSLEQKNENLEAALRGLQSATDQVVNMTPDQLNAARARGEGNPNPISSLASASSTAKRALRGTLESGSSDSSARVEGPVEAKRTRAPKDQQGPLSPLSPVRPIRERGGR